MPVDRTGQGMQWTAVDKFHVKISVDSRGQGMQWTKKT